MPRTKTIADLEQELADKRRKLQELESKRKTLASQLAKVDKNIAKLQGEPQAAKAAAPAKKAAPKRRARRGGKRKWRSLADALAAVLEGQDGVKVGDAARMVQKAGYRTKAKNFGTIVSQTLASDKRFKRVSRGVYALAGK